MNKQKLIEQLNAIGINADFQLLSDGFISNGITLEKTVNHYDNNKEYTVWNVYENDRGRINEKAFYSENEAFLEILKRLKEGEQYKIKK